MPRVHSLASSVQSPASRAQSPASNFQSPVSSLKSPVSRIQRPSLASRVQEFWYAIIVHLNTLTHPSRELLQMEFNFNCTVICNEAFGKLKLCVNNDTCLSYFGESVYVAQITRTPPRMGYLCHTSINKEKDDPKTVSYSSRSLSPTDQRYYQIKWEFFSIV